MGIDISSLDKVQCKLQLAHWMLLSYLPTRQDLNQLADIISIGLVDGGHISDSPPFHIILAILTMRAVFSSFNESKIEELLLSGNY